MERRLVAVLVADVVGYSRLTGIDEEGTRARFREDLRDVFEPRFARHRGRLVKTMGDGLGQGADLLETRGWDDRASGVIEV